MTFERLLKHIIRLGQIRQRMNTQTAEDAQDWLDLTELQCYLEVQLEKLERE